MMNASSSSSSLSSSSSPPQSQYARPGLNSSANGMMRHQQHTIKAENQQKNHQSSNSSSSSSSISSYPHPPPTTASANQHPTAAGPSSSSPSPSPSGGNDTTPPILNGIHTATNPRPSSEVAAASFGQIQYSEAERNFLQSTLEEKLTNEYISTRAGPGGGQVHYIETWRAIELANHTFGFNGWSSSIVEITADYVDENQGKFSCGVSAVVRVTIKDGCFHEDIGYGYSENQRQKSAAFEQAKKKAVSDGLKRALRNYGNALGLTVYDRDHLKIMKRQAAVKRASGAAKLGGGGAGKLGGMVQQQHQQQQRQATTSSRPVNPHFSQSYASQQSQPQPQPQPQDQSQSQAQSSPPMETKPQLSPPQQSTNQAGNSNTNNWRANQQQQQKQLANGMNSSHHGRPLGAMGNMNGGGVGQSTMNRSMPTANAAQPLVGSKRPLGQNDCQSHSSSNNGTNALHPGSVQNGGQFNKRQKPAM